MLTVPAHEIAFPMITYRDDAAVDPRNNHEPRRPQWSLEGRTFLEGGADEMSTNILVLVPTKFNGQAYDRNTIKAFADECVHILGEEIVKYGGTAF